MISVERAANVSQFLLSSRVLILAMMWIGAAINAVQNLLDDIAISLADTAHVRALDWERGKVVFEYTGGNASRKIPLRAGSEREQERIAALRQRVESLDAIDKVPRSAEDFTLSTDSVQSIFPSDKESARSLDATRESLSSEQESGQHSTNELIVVTPHNTTSRIAIPQPTFEQPTPLSTDSIFLFPPWIEISSRALAPHAEPPQIHANERALSAFPIQARDVSSPPSTSSESVALDPRGGDATNANLNQPEGVAVAIRRTRAGSGRHRKVKRRLSEVLWLFYLADHLRFPSFFALINAWHKLLEKSICCNVALKRRCRERNLGPKEIELLIGVSPQRLAELEDMCPPTWDEVVEFSDLLECSPEFLWPGWRRYVVLGEEIPIAHLDKRDTMWEGDPVFEEAAYTLLYLQLSEVFDSLREKERIVLLRYFELEGYSERILRKISAKQKTKGSRVEVIKDEALWRLRRPYHAQKLREYLSQFRTDKTITALCW